MNNIKWYLQYAWVKLNIWILTPIVWVQNKYNEYQQIRLETYVKYVCEMDNLNKKDYGT